MSKVKVNIFEVRTGADRMNRATIRSVILLVTVALLYVFAALSAINTNLFL